jgi:hypothetical protein
MTSEKNDFAKDLLLQLFKKHRPEQQKVDEKKIRAEICSEVEKHNLGLLELRRKAVENLSGIELQRQLKLYDDYESVFRKWNDLQKEWVYGDAEKFYREWDSVVNEYKSLLQREKFYANVGQQAKQPASGKVDLPTEKQAETEQNGTPSKKEKGSVNVNIFGDVKAGKLQIAQDVSIHEQLVQEEKKKGIVGKILEILGTIITFILKKLWPKLNPFR